MRGLVLSGGGANGAYEVGALKHLLCDLGIVYSIICGVSVGALNGAFLSQFPIGSEVTAFRQLESLWCKVETKDVYKKWYGGFLWYLPVLWKESIYDSSPLRKLVGKNLSTDKIKSSGRKLRVVSVAADTGEKVAWSEDNPDISEGVLASSSFPLFFNPIFYNEILHTDGGIRDITPMGEAIKLEATELDVVVCYPPTVGYEKRSGTKIHQQGLRFLDIVFNEMGRNDLKLTELHNHACKNGVGKPGKREIKLRLIQPQKSLGDSLDFSREKNKRLMEWGYRDAVATGLVDE